MGDKSRKKIIVFVNFTGIGRNTAFNSQILEYIRMQVPFHRMGYLGVEKRSSSLGSGSEHRSRLNSLKRAAAFAFSPPTRSYFNLVSHSVLLYRLLRRLQLNGMRTLVHGRTEFSSLPGIIVRAFLPRTKVIHDARGVHRLEMVGRENWILKIRRGLTGTYERLAIRWADRVICVSSEFKEYIRKYTGRQENIQVIPSLINDSELGFDAVARKTIRMRLGLESRIVICYVGGLQKHQHIPELLKDFREIRALIPECHLLFLTFDTCAAKELMHKYGVPQDAFTIRAVSRKDISAYYSAADYGMLIREDNLVNRVASPIKLGEYLRHGLPVLCSSVIYEKYPEHSRYLLRVHESSDVSRNLEHYSGFINMNAENAVERRQSIIKQSYRYQPEKYRENYRELYS